MILGECDFSCYVTIMHNFLGAPPTKPFPIIVQILLEQVLFLTFCSKWCKLGSHKQDLNKGVLSLKAPLFTL